MNKLPKLNPLKVKCTEQAYKLTLGDMAKKVDELVKSHNKLIDYLGDREEASKYKVISFNPVGETVPASRGEYKQCLGCITVSPQSTTDLADRTDLRDRSNKKHHYPDVGKKVDPPEHDEWVCKRCGYKNTSYVSQKCTGKQTEHDPWEEFDKQFSVGIGRKWIMTQEEAVEVKDYIEANYISKRKIKYEIEECSNYHDPEQVLKGELLEALRLDL